MTVDVLQKIILQCVVISQLLITPPYAFTTKFAMTPRHDELNILDELPYGVLLVDGRDFTIKYCNRQGRLTTHTHEFDNTGFFDLFPSLDLPGVRSALKSAIENSTTHWIKNHRLRDDSAPVTISLKGIHENALITFLAQHADSDIAAVPGPGSLRRELAALEALQQREEIFRLLIENSKDGIAILTKKGEIIYVSPSVKSILGYTESEAIELNVLSIIYNRTGERKKFRELLSTKRSIDSELQIRHKEGNLIWIEFSITNFLDTPGINAIVINFRDVTERKNAEQLIMAKEKQFSSLADAMPQLVWIAAPDGTVTYYNKRVTEYAGAKQNQDGSWDWELLLHDEDNEPTWRTWNEAVREKKIYYKEHRVQMKTGEYRYHLSRAYPQFDAEGNVVKWYGTATDIHEQKQAQAYLEQYTSELERKVNERTIEVRREKEFVETILDASIDEIAVYDRETRLINGNLRFFEKFHLKKSDALGKKLLDLFPMGQEGNKRLMRVFDGETLYYPAWYSPVAQSYYDSYLIPLRDFQNYIYSALVIVRDVTENIRNEELLRISADKLKEVNESLMKKNHELEQFAYIASHDLQEPLRKISTFANLLEQSRQQPENFTRFTKKIIESSNRMAKLISDVLQYSQLNSKGEITKLDLNEIFKNIQTDLDLLIEQKNATILVDELPTIQGVSRQITQLFYNLLSNALKFTQPDIPAVIEIKCKLLNSIDHLNLKAGVPYYQISVQDNGIGFDQEYAEKIFQMFHRLNSKEQFTGSGIGLAMVRKIVSSHHGEVWAESTLDQGATFHVVLPALQPLVESNGIAAENSLVNKKQ